MVEYPLETTPCCAMAGEKEMMLSVSKWRFHEGNYHISLHQAWHGRVRERSFQPPQKKLFWIISLTPLFVIINVLYCIVMYCQWQLAKVSLMRHLRRTIFKKSAITAWCHSIAWAKLLRALIHNNNHSIYLSLAVCDINYNFYRCITVLLSQSDSF